MTFVPEIPQAIRGSFGPAQAIASRVPLISKGFFPRTPTVAFLHQFREFDVTELFGLVPRRAAD